MTDITLLQTLEDRNHHLVEEEGPFRCTKTHAWLGVGYYFWDTHIELGHWWGATNFSLRGYIICQAEAVLDKTCWDLHGNGRHRLELKAICDEMISKKVDGMNGLTIPNIIEFFKEKRKFAYKAIRALGTQSIGNSHEEFILRLPFTNQKPSYLAPYLDFYPPVQICLVDKKALSLINYRIVHPSHYVVDSYA